MVGIQGSLGSQQVRSPPPPGSSTACPHDPAAAAEAEHGSDQNPCQGLQCSFLASAGGLGCKQHAARSPADVSAGLFAAAADQPPNHQKAPPRQWDSGPSEGPPHKSQGADSRFATQGCLPATASTPASGLRWRLEACRSKCSRVRSKEKQQQSHRQPTQGSRRPPKLSPLQGHPIRHLAEQRAM